MKLLLWVVGLCDLAGYLYWGEYKWMLLLAVACITFPILASCDST